MADSPTSYAELSSVPATNGDIDFRSIPSLDGYSFHYVNQTLHASRFGSEFLITDGRRKLSFSKIDAKIERKWLSLRGLNLGALGIVEFHWPARSSSDYWSVEALKQPEGEILEVKVEDRAGLRLDSKCSIEWNSEAIDARLALAVLGFFWAMAERDRNFNA